MPSKAPPPAPPAPPRLKRWGIPLACAAVCGGLAAALMALSPRPGVDPIVGDLADAGDPPELVWVPGGTFTMGSDAGADDEKPPHEVTVQGFWFGKTEVTNAQYARFVQATNYVTVAERVPDARRYPGARPENLVAGSAVFTPGEYDTSGPPVWWRYVKGANWKHPEGPGTTAADKPHHPVRQIAWDDAVAYCRWSGQRLPTEAEWEYAARGNVSGKEYVWGSEAQGAGGKWHANTWQGPFPKADSGADGFVGVAPVARFAANGFGLHDLSGNVWEWCSDNYASDYYGRSPKHNPRGPEVGQSEGGQALKVRRGGSYLCCDEYCRRYVPNARDQNPADSGASHTGFRVAADAR